MTGIVGKKKATPPVEIMCNLFNSRGNLIVSSVTSVSFKADAGGG